jgi:hypothetical protein
MSITLIVVIIIQHVILFTLLILFSKFTFLTCALNYHQTRVYYKQSNPCLSSVHLLAAPLVSSLIKVLILIFPWVSRYTIVIMQSHFNQWGTSHRQHFLLFGTWSISSRDESLAFGADWCRRMNLTQTIREE